MAKSAGLKTLVICNVDNSSMTRVADFTILTRAGIEKGVASTKAFSTQTVVLWMLSLYFASKLKKLFLRKTWKKNSSKLFKSSKIMEKTKKIIKKIFTSVMDFSYRRDYFYPLF